MGCPQQRAIGICPVLLLVTTHINHVNQLLPVVRYWLPHVRIVEPKAWHEALVKEMQQVLIEWTR